MVESTFYWKVVSSLFDLDLSRQTKEELWFSCLESDCYLKEHKLDLVLKITESFLLLCFAAELNSTRELYFLSCIFLF